MLPESAATNLLAYFDKCLASLLLVLDVNNNIMTVGESFPKDETLSRDLVRLKNTCLIFIRMTGGSCWLVWKG